MRADKNKSLKYQRGVTLVELLLYMGLFSGFLVLLSGLFISILDVQQESVDTARIEQDSQYLFSRLQYDLLRADDVLQPAENGQSDDVLVLLIDDVELVYMLDGSRVSISSASSAFRPLTSPEVTASNLSFQRLGNEEGYPSIRAELTLQSTTQGTSVPETRDLFYTFGTR
jgi:hypothetical protein